MLGGILRGATAAAAAPGATHTAANAIIVLYGPPAACKCASKVAALGLTAAATEITL
jgi:hypothetical protein